MPTAKGTKENPWKLKTPPGTSEYTIYQDGDVLVCTVGKTVLQYDAWCIKDLPAMLKKHGDWIELGAADEQKPTKSWTVEGWARHPKNPIGGRYGLKKGLRGRFAMYIPLLLEAMGLVELENNTRANRMRVK